MKGTEGIDYVITECGHCKGNGKCNCYRCLYSEAENAVTKHEGNKYYIADRDEKIEYFKTKQFLVPCIVCAGIGKVVFWRE